MKDLLVNVKELGVISTNNMDLVKGGTLVESVFSKDKFYQLYDKNRIKYLVAVRSCSARDFDLTKVKDLDVEVAFELGLISHVDLQTARAKSAQSITNARIEEARSQVRKLVEIHGPSILD